MTTLEGASGGGGGGVEIEFDYQAAIVRTFAANTIYDLAEVTFTLEEGQKAILIGAASFNNGDLTGSVLATLRLTDGTTNYDESGDIGAALTTIHEHSIYRQITQAGRYTFKLQGSANMAARGNFWRYRSLLALIV